MSHAAQIAYTPSQPYATNRLPDGPRYVVPPPDLQYGGGKAIFTLTSSAPQLNTSAEFGNPVFLQALVGSGNLQIRHQALDWKYEQRRAAQKILPYMFLGPGTAAQNIDFVKQQGITLMVAVRSAFAARMHARLLDPSKFRSATGLQSLILDLESPYDMITKLPQAIKIINNHIEQSCQSVVPVNLEDIPARVLVFCESGNDRSATVVTAYMMVLYGLNAIEAMQMVQSQRFCLAIEDGSKNMLQTFEDILRAKRDVATNDNIATRALNQNENGPSATATVRKVSKRSYNDAIDSDEDMDDGDEVAIEHDVEGRSGQAPFQDR